MTAISNDALIALLAGETPAAGGSAAPAKSEKRPASKHWLNVGVEVNGKFISLGGIALDDLKPIEAKGTNEEWHQMVAAKNALLAAVQGTVGAYDPGHSEIIKGLRVQGLRKSEGAVEGSNDASTNPLLAGLAKALAG